MRYPQHLETHFGSAAAFARRINAEKDVPRPITGEAVCNWRYRDKVAWPYRAIVARLDNETQIEPAKADLQEAS